MTAATGSDQQSAGQPPRIAIVGAGLAGLVAAHRLHHHKLDVHVFDKGRGVGGRTSVRRHDGLEFDHGAQYFTVRDERFAAQVRAWQRAGVADLWHSRIGVYEDGAWRESPAQARYVGVPGMNAIARHLARDLQVSTGSRVAALMRAEDRWRLCDDTGAELGSFAAVIVALPAPQAADLLRGRSTLADPAAHCSMSPCWAVMLGFEAPLEVEFDAAFINDPPLAWIARNNAKPGRSPGSAWTLHAAPQWSADHLEETPARVTDTLTHEFRRLIGRPVPATVHVAAHRWRYASVPQPLNVGSLCDADAQLVVCGDWCQGGRVEGAFLSGLHAAARLIRTFDRSDAE